MLPKRWIVGVSSVILVVLLFAGYMAIAAEVGSQDDPLVTLSYIEDLLPELKATIDSVITAKTAEFDTAIEAKAAEVSAKLDEKINNLGSDYAGIVQNQEFISQVAQAVSGYTGGAVSSPGDSANLFTVVKVASGKTVIGKIGTEILWRIGTASCVASGTPGLIDVTAGSDLSSGGALQANHLYIVTVEGRGFKATSDCVILIKGSYTMS